MQINDLDIAVESLHYPYNHSMNKSLDYMHHFKKQSHHIINPTIQAYKLTNSHKSTEKILGELDTFERSSLDYRGSITIP